MVKKSFQVCSISSLDPHKVENGAFPEQCMRNTLDNLEANDVNEIDDDLFELNDEYTTMKSVINNYD